MLELQLITIQQTTTQTLAPMVNLGRPCRCLGAVIPTPPLCDAPDDDDE